MEMERDSARETSSELRVRVAELESAAKEGLEARERERREGDLGRRLEVEETSRRRAETKLARLTEEVRCPFPFDKSFDLLKISFPRLVQHLMICSKG